MTFNFKSTTKYLSMRSQSNRRDRDKAMIKCYEFKNRDMIEGTKTLKESLIRTEKRLEDEWDKPVPIKFNLII